MGRILLLMGVGLFFRVLFFKSLKLTLDHAIILAFAKFIILLRNLVVFGACSIDTLLTT
jgi:hypothetical protein